jgi:hypothetical protein
MVGLRQQREAALGWASPRLAKKHRVLFWLLHTPQRSLQSAGPVLLINPALLENQPQLRRRGRPRKNAFAQKPPP